MRDLVPFGREVAKIGEPRPLDVPAARPERRRRAVTSPPSPLRLWRDLRFVLPDSAAGWAALAGGCAAGVFLVGIGPWAALVVLGAGTALLVLRPQWFATGEQDPTREDPTHRRPVRVWVTATARDLPRRRRALRGRPVTVADVLDSGGGIALPAVRRVEPAALVLDAGRVSPSAPAGRSLSGAARDGAA